MTLFVQAFEELAETHHRQMIDNGFHDEPRTTDAVADVVKALDLDTDDDSVMDALFKAIDPYARRQDGELIALMHSELSEMLEGVRKPGPDEHLPEFDSTTVEAADVILRVMDWAQLRKKPVAEAVVAKMKYNATRGHRHGGKLI